MIRRMKRGEEDDVRTLYAKLSFEDQTFWREQMKSLEEYLEESSKMPISGKIKGENVILVAEEDGKIVGFCWCTIVDRRVEKQGEVAELYVEKKYRDRGIAKELINAAKQLFFDEQVEVAFAWTHYGNEAAIKLYKDAGFKEVDQLVMALVLSNKNKPKV